MAGRTIQQSLPRQVFSILTEVFKISVDFCVLVSVHIHYVPKTGVLLNLLDLIIFHLYWSLCYIFGLHLYCFHAAHLKAYCLAVVVQLYLHGVWMICGFGDEYDVICELEMCQQLAVDVQTTCSVNIFDEHFQTCSKELWSDGTSLVDVFLNCKFYWQ